MAELDGPRLEPRSGPARQLIVFLHGYGADGNDLIDIGRAWQGLAARHRTRDGCVRRAEAVRARGARRDRCAGPVHRAALGVHVRTLEINLTVLENSA